MAAGATVVTKRPFTSPYRLGCHDVANGFTIDAPTIDSRRPYDVDPPDGPMPNTVTSSREIAWTVAVTTRCSGNSVGLDVVWPAVPKCAPIGASAASTNLVYQPTRHAFVEASPSTSQLMRQASVVLCPTHAKPAPKPFCGAMLPTVTWNGCPVNSVVAQSTTLNAPQLSASFAVSLGESTGGGAVCCALAADGMINAAASAHAHPMRVMRGALAAPGGVRLEPSDAGAASTTVDAPSPSPSPAPRRSVDGAHPSRARRKWPPALPS